MQLVVCSWLFIKLSAVHWALTHWAIHGCVVLCTNAPGLPSSSPCCSLLGLSSNSYLLPPHLQGLLIACQRSLQSLPLRSAAGLVWALAGLRFKPGWQWALQLFATPLSIPGTPRHFPPQPSPSPPQPVLSLPPSHVSPPGPSQGSQGRQAPFHEPLRPPALSTPLRPPSTPAALRPLLFAPIRDAEEVPERPLWAPQQAGMTAQQQQALWGQAGGSRAGEQQQGLGGQAGPAEQQQQGPWKQAGPAEQQQQALWGQAGGSTAAEQQALWDQPRRGRVSSSEAQAWVRDVAMLIAAVARLQLRPLPSWTTSLLACLPHMLETASSHAGQAQGRQQQRLGGVDRSLPASLANLTWGMLRLRVVPPMPLLLQLLQLSQANVQQLPPARQLVLLWACASLLRMALAVSPLGPDSPAASTAHAEDSHPASPGTQTAATAQGVAAVHTGVGAGTMAGEGIGTSRRRMQLQGYVRLLRPQPTVQRPTHIAAPKAAAATAARGSGARSGSGPRAGSPAAVHNPPHIRTVRWRLVCLRLQPTRVVQRAGRGGRGQRRLGSAGQPKPHAAPGSPPLQSLMAHECKRSMHSMLGAMLHSSAPGLHALNLRSLGTSIAAVRLAAQLAYRGGPSSSQSGMQSLAARPSTQEDPPSLTPNQPPPSSASAQPQSSPAPTLAPLHPSQQLGSHPPAAALEHWLCEWLLSHQHLLRAQWVGAGVQTTASGPAASQPPSGAASHVLQCISALAPIVALRAPGAVLPSHLSGPLRGWLAAAMPFLTCSAAVAAVPLPLLLQQLPQLVRMCQVCGAHVSSAFSSRLYLNKYKTNVDV